MMTDDELVEKMARVLKEHPLVPFTHDAALTLATAALAVARPVIRAQALEEAAQACDRRYMGDNNREDMEARRCAAAIRALKEKE